MLSKNILLKLFLLMTVLNLHSFASGSSTIKAKVDKIFHYKGTWYIRYQDVILGDDDATEGVFIDGNLDRTVNIGNSVERGFPLVSRAYDPLLCHEAYINIYDGQHNLVSKSDVFEFGNLTKCNGITPPSDTVKPVIRLIGGDVALTVGDTYTDAGARASDDVEGDITADIKVTSTVNTGLEGTYVVKYNVKDTAGNQANEVIRKVIVRNSNNNTNIPIIKKVFNYKGRWYIHYYDVSVNVNNAKEEVLVNAVVDRVVQSGRAEDRGFPLAHSYDSTVCNTIEIKIYDGFHNLVKKSNVFEFGDLTKCNGITPPIDSVKPIITLLGQTTVNLIKGESYSDAGATALDDSDGDITSSIVVQNPVDVNRIGRYIIRYDVNDSAGNSAIQLRRTVNVSSQNNYSYIPTVLTEKESSDFLISSAFGATARSKSELNQKGVVQWVDEQFALPYVPNQHLRRTIILAKKSEPSIHTASVADYLADNDIVFNQNKASVKVQQYQMSAWFETALVDEDQLRHRVAYALSQIVVESLAEPFFLQRGEGLAAYMDIVTKNAFGNYKNLLLDISHSSSMGLYLTFNGSKKEQQDGSTTIYPDENYAREIMQLFSIGLSELNLDGTPKLDANGNTIPSYTQTDVNELAKVFTGWDLKRSRGFGKVSFTRGDVTHPLEFTAEHHDFGAKTILGTTIQGGNDGDADIAAAISILMAHPNVAPFISKQLIMRLAKSNPTPAYVARVATVFNDNGNGVKGDLKAVVRAILLDREFWDGSGIKKFKEPLIAYTQFLRAFNVQALPAWRINSAGADVLNAFYIQDPTFYLGQGPCRASTVFNFYDNNFIPNESSFKQQKSVAPELQIQTDSMIITFNNKLTIELQNNEKRDILAKYGTLSNIDTLISANFRPAFRPYYSKFLLDCGEEYDVLEKELEGTVDGHFKSFNGVRRGNDTTADANGVTNRDRALIALIEHLDKKLTGSRLTQEHKNILFEGYKELFYTSSMVNLADPQTKIYREIMVSVIIAIVTSETYMTR